MNKRKRRGPGWDQIGVIGRRVLEARRQVARDEIRALTRDFDQLANEEVVPTAVVKNVVGVRSPAAVGKQLKAVNAGCGAGTTRLFLVGDVRAWMARRSSPPARDRGYSRVTRWRKISEILKKATDDQLDRFLDEVEAVDPST